MNLDDDHDEVPVTHRDLINEFQDPQNINEALIVLQLFTNRLQYGLGRYGSINVGPVGNFYKEVRNFLTNERQTADGRPMPNLRRYLTYPVLDLPVYNGAGPGGQGDSKIALNRCYANVRDKIQRVLGMLFVLQRNDPGEIHLALAAAPQQ